MRTTPHGCLLASVLVAACGGAGESTTPDLGTAPRPPPVRITAITRPPDPPKEKLPIDPRAAEVLRANVGRPPVALSEAAPPEVTGMALDATARSEARGLVREGGVRTAEVAEGGRAASPISVASGDCFTIIAHGGIGVAEVDVFVVKRDGDAFEILAQDARTGPLGIVGGQRGCVSHLGPAVPQAELWVQARSGSGPIVVGIYRAPKAT